MEITAKQEEALRQKWAQSPDGKSWEEFRNSIRPELGWPGHIMVQWCNMWVGITPDGYAHT